MELTCLLQRNEILPVNLQYQLKINEQNMYFKSTHILMQLAK